MSRPGFRYEVAEHIAYCSSCVARSLDPEDSAKLVLREVLDLPNREAARIVDLSVRVGVPPPAGRGAAHDDRGVRRPVRADQQAGHLPPVQHAARAVPARPPALAVEPLGDVATGEPDALLDRRLAAVRGADVVAGSTTRMHAVLLRFIARHADPPSSD